MMKDSNTQTSDAKIIPFAPSPSLFTPNHSTYKRVKAKSFISPLSLFPPPSHYIFCRVHGSALVRAGVHDNDIAIVNTVQAIKSGDIVAAQFEDGQLIVQRLEVRGRRLWLVSEESGFHTCEISAEQLLGKITHAIHSFEQEKEPEREEDES